MKTKAISFYFDTTCAVKLFLKEEQEKGSAKLKEYLEKHEYKQYLSSSLIKLEWQSAFRAKLKGNQINSQQMKKLEISWHELISNMVIYPIDNNIIENATDIVKNTNVVGRVRSLDCIHLATYLMFKRSNKDIILLSTDDVMCNLAKEYTGKYFNPLE